VGTHVLLLRGVNIGSTRTIAMPELRDLLAGLGYDNVRTYLRSGNAVLAAPGVPSSELAATVEEELADTFSHRIPVLVRTRDEWARIVDRNPLPEAVVDPAKFLVICLTGPADPAQASRLDPDAFRPDRFRVDGHEIYQWSPNGVSKTKLTTTFWERQLGVIATARNWNTVTALITMLDDS
jgi:uncharacterized protein (DUF1697 family)